MTKEARSTFLRHSQEAHCVCREFTRRRAQARRQDQNLPSIMDAFRIAAARGTNTNTPPSRPQAAQGEEQPEDSSVELYRALS